jgi:Zn-dependent membrane protease YugP
MLPGLILVLIAKWWVNSTQRKWSEIRNGAGVSGLEAARRLLQYGGIGNLSMEGVAGNLTDHYDPRDRTLRLSEGVANGRSVASLAIAAHEIGHAMQDHLGYLPLRFRTAIVPAVNIGSRLGLYMIIIGLILRSAFGTQLATVGVVLFALGALFSLLTLPLELNASARAKALLGQSGLIRNDQERRGVNAVLTAAAFTYVAALAASVLQLLYWTSLISGGGRRRG